MVSGKLLHDTGSSRSVLWLPSGVGCGGRYEEGSGGGGHMYTCG